MKFKKLDQGTFALIFDKGDEFIDVLTSFARKRRTPRQPLHGDRCVSRCHARLF